MTRIYLYDTTLRDGVQMQGVDLSVSDKKYLLSKLDAFKIDYVEGGWPGANPIDTAFFDAFEPTLYTKVSAFGMTQKQPSSSFDKVLENKAPCVTIVGKSWDFHVTHALGISLDENLALIRESVLRAKTFGKEVLFDAEHFFDGFKANPDYAISCIKTAWEAGASWLVLCDTNGGTLPFEIEERIKAVSERLPKAPLGVHCHNDTGNAVANSLAAVRAGVRLIQGTINGVGERCGNADLMAIIPTLMLKMGFETGLTRDDLKHLTNLSGTLYERLNLLPNKYQPYVGASAFTHKGGLHVSAIAKSPVSYEHINPEEIGNRRRILVSQQSGKSNILSFLKTMGIETDRKDPRIGELLKIVKEKEYKGYSYDGAEASFELLVKNFLSMVPVFFELSSFRVIDERRYNIKGELVTTSDATVRMRVDGKDYIEAADGNGPVDALANALFKVLIPVYGCLKDFRLEDYKVRIFDSDKGTGSTTRVLIDAADKEGHHWSTVGFSDDIIDASFQALQDSILYKLMLSYK